MDVLRTAPTNSSAILNSVSGFRASCRLYTDQVGRPWIISDALGVVVGAYQWKPFGEVHSHSGTATVELRFQGQFHQGETGLNYNWFRTYDPIVGRYTQPDPVGLQAGINRYAYVRNNPLEFFDILGLTAICPINKPMPSMSGWKKYDKSFWMIPGNAVFHCGYDVFLEDRDPSPDDPQAECAYDEWDNLVTSDSPFCGCMGTANQFAGDD